LSQLHLSIKIYHKISTELHVVFLGRDPVKPISQISVIIKLITFLLWAAHTTYCHMMGHTVMNRKGCGRKLLWWPSWESHSVLTLKKKVPQNSVTPSKEQQCPPTSFPFQFITTHPISQNYEYITNKRDKVTVEWRKLYNEELYDLYSSPNIFRVIKLWSNKWVGHLACMGREVHTGFWWGNLGRPRCRWEDNINMDLGWKGMDWIDLLQDRNRWWTLVMQQWTFGLHKMLGISRLAEDLWATQKGLCST
jgi:hypothetical protein